MSQPKPAPIETRDAEESVVSVLRASVREAPPPARRQLRIIAFSMVGALVLAVVLMAWDGDGVDLEDVLAMAFIFAASVFLASTQILHGVSQRQGASCGKSNLFVFRSQVMDRVFLALPVLAVLASVCYAIGIGMMFGIFDTTKPIKIVLGFGVIGLMLVYLVASVRAVIHTTKFLYRYGREQAEAAARAREEAVEAQLAALQSQMNPHFLFNALNTVASLVRTNGRSAEATIENLAQVLRRTLDRSRATSGTLAEEVEYLRAYLGVEQERWGERLSVRWDLDTEALDTALPPLTLQPLVENALVHGVGNRLEGGEVAIEARRRNGKLVVSVRDDGPGFPRRYREGTGLGNLRQRLATLYGEAGVLRVAERGEGAEVVIEVPAERAQGTER